MGGAIGSLLLYIISIQYGLIIAFLILSISFFFLNYALKVK
jgi:accessory gene regulator protein AgrB